MRWRITISTVLVCGVATALGQLPPVPSGPGSEVQRVPRLFVAQRLLDLGHVFEGDKRPVQWLLENHGAADLVIEQTKASCGCTVVHFSSDDRIIPPGGSLVLEAEFNSKSRRGTQSKSVTVYSNDPAEPQLKLEFKAEVEVLYNLKPSGVLNLRSVQRGRPAGVTLDVFPGKKERTVEIVDVVISGDASLSYVLEARPPEPGRVQRIRFTVADDAPVGKLRAKATIKLRIDGIDRERELSIRGEVVGDLTWLPKVVDATRQPSRRGKRLAPVTIRSANKMPFEVLGVSAGPRLDAAVEEIKGKPKGTRYNVRLTIREDAPPGPFGTMLNVRTSSLDQPLVQVPVFAIVSPLVRIDPPMVLLRQDGSPAGTKRRVKLQASLRTELRIAEATCENAAVKVTIDREAGPASSHVQWLNVSLVGRLPKGTHESVIVLTTTVDGARRLEIPVTVRVPG